MAAPRRDPASRQQGVSVHLDRVTKVFGVGQESTEAVSDVSLDIGSGEFVSLIGPSGCGKTTLARIVGGLIQQTSGEVLLDGQPPESVKAEQRIGFVFQAPTLVSWRNLRRNVTLPLEILKWPKSQRDQRADELLQLVGLEGFEDYYPDQVSGGMQQRASMARALSYRPGLLLMDEPLGALDMITRDRMAFELLRIWESSKSTVLFITHSIDEAILLSDRVVISTPRPAKVLEVVNVPLPRPRIAEHRTAPEFTELAKKLRGLLES